MILRIWRWLHRPSPSQRRQLLNAAHHDLAAAWRSYEQSLTFAACKTLHEQLQHFVPIALDILQKDHPRLMRNTPEHALPRMIEIAALNSHNLDPTAVRLACQEIWPFSYV